jgi:hypothetical protein
MKKNFVDMVTWNEYNIEQAEDSVQTAERICEVDSNHDDI